MIERKKAKDNLEAVVELTQRYVEDYSLFDRQWYEMRANRRFRGEDCLEDTPDEDTADSVSFDSGCERVGKDDNFQEISA